MPLAVRLLRELLAGSGATSWLACSLFFCKMVEVEMFYSLFIGEVEQDFRASDGP